MKVIVYVEGSSDRVALEALLGPLIDEGKRRGIGVQLVPLGNKGAILDRAPLKAAAGLRDRPDDWYMALPDLYPMKCYFGTANEHRSLVDLRRLLEDRFRKKADEVGVDASALRRFSVHCLKHDLEALILAAPDALRRRLKTQDKLAGAWRLPVEDQNDGEPPKSIVTRLFGKYQKREYQGTIDAPWVLVRSDLPDTERQLRQCFAPFVAELRSIVAASPSRADDALGK